MTGSSSRGALLRGLNRRSFLQWMALVSGGAAGALLGCDAPESRVMPEAEDMSADVGADDTPADVDALFEAVQRALRESPDHTPARAAALVASADLAGLLAFVRDDIQTYPTRHNHMANAVAEQRWGWQGALRGGAGTPREKAEVLAELYRQAGYEAEVFGGRLTSPPPDWRSWLIGRTRPAFAPSLTPDQVARWGQAFGADPDAGQAIDGDAKGAVALAQALLPHLEADWFGRRAFDFRASDRWPLVRVRRDGQTLVANLWDPLASLEDPRVRAEDVVAPAAPPTQPMAVEVVLEGTLSDDLASPVEFVRGRWSAADVAGRQLVMKLEPALTLEQAAQTAIKDVNTFVPLLVWQGAGVSDEEASTLSVVGEARMSSGRTIVVDDTRVWVDGTLVEGPEIARGRAHDVARLEVHRVNASRFPEIIVEATAWDDSGQFVEGLRASDWLVFEDAIGQSATLRCNSRRPRIVVLADDSGSMPPAFRGDAGAEFARQLLERLKTDNPLAEISFRKTGSAIYTEAAAASLHQPSLIIYLTDGDATDGLTPEVEQALRQGPPVLAISVYAMPDADLQALADLSGGDQFLIGEVDEALRRAAEYVANQDIPSYIISYTAPRAGAEHREVRLATHAGVAHSVGYDVPALPAMPPRIVGLTLRIKMTHDAWGVREHAVHLAGYLSANATLPATMDDADAVRDWCFGAHLLAFEGAMPSRSVVLDDYLDAKLSSKALRVAAAKNDAQGMRDAWDAGIRVLPKELFTTQAPLSDFAAPDRLAFEDGLRITMYSQMPQIGTNVVRRRLDIMPTSRIAIASDAEGLTQVAQVIEVTASLAMGEAAMFDMNTHVLLADEELFAARRGSRNPHANAADARLASRWDALSDLNTAWIGIYPVDATLAAWWTLDPDTGALCGRILGGQGGGDQAEAIQRQIEEINDALEWANELVLLGASRVPSIGGFALGVVALYGQLLVRLYGAVAITIALLDASMLGDRVRRALLIFACQVMESALNAVAGKLVKFWDSVQSVLTLLTIEVPSACPDA